MATKAPEARQHHVVPASYLAAFANDGSKDGRLFVWSPEQRRVWPSTPRKTGKERDYYRIDKEGVDPLAAENALGEIEAETAPLIRHLIDTGRLPNREDFEVVLLFVALLEARGRSMRAPRGYDGADGTDRHAAGPYHAGALGAAQAAHLG